MAQILARMFMGGGLHVLAVSEFMSRIRGGSNSVTLRAATTPVRALSGRVDLCLLFDGDALPRLRGRCGPETLWIGDPQIITGQKDLIPLPLQELKKESGGAIYSNSPVCGYLVRMIGWDLSLLEKALARTFTDPAPLTKNCAAARRGWEAAKAVAGRTPLPLGIARPGRPLFDGSQSVALGALAGHGEFPRAILAPGSPEEAFACAAHAFTMADTAQAPIFLLTDQYLLDTLSDLEPFALPEFAPEGRIITTPLSYQRYAPGRDDVSHRGIPGNGKGLVCVDSDEHDIGGRITEDFAVRIAMVDKRLAKTRLLREDLALAPRLYGSKNYRRLLVGWGSTAAAVVEALAQLQPKSTAFLHCLQPYPLSAATLEYLQRAAEIIVIENNATGQFARLLRAENACRVDKEWHKYNGLAFSVEEVVELLRQEVER